MRSGHRGRVPLARRYLMGEKVRLAMSVAGVAFAVLLILIVASLYRGWSEVSIFFNDLPGEVWITQEGTGDPFRTSSLLPLEDATDIAHIGGVATVLPVYARTITLALDGTDPHVFFMGIGPPPDDSPSSQDPATGASEFLPPPGSIVIDEVMADEANLGVGDSVDVLGRPLSVSSIRTGGNPLFPIAFINGGDASTLLGIEGFASFFLVRPQPGVDPAAVAAAVTPLIPGSEAHTSEQFADVVAEQVDRGFLPVVGALVGIGFVIGGAVVALTTYTATVERLGDFAVLKAVGASAGFVYGIVIRQSLVVGVLGSLSGVACSWLVATLVKRGVPEFVTDLQLGDVLGVFAVTLVVSLAAASVPARRINRIDPGRVFRP